MARASVLYGLLFALLSALVWSPAGGHIDSPSLTDECGSCHVGHGKPQEPMLAKSEEDFCYQCHGSDSERSRMIQEGRLVAGTRLDDLRADFDKMYSHPVNLEGVHDPAEKLPSYDAGTTPHAECVDCHNPHQRISEKGRLNYKVSGYSISGQYLEESVHEYEICLKCHSGQLAGKRSTQSLVRSFAVNARSQHPVVNARLNKGLPSLRDKIMSEDRMLCSDCHRSDDPDGAKGPHGSNHEFLLSGNYNRDIFVQESPYEFQFCYSCHERSSILNNESFPWHRQHIQGDLMTGQRGTSCFTCHASHGSPDNPNLIRFNPEAVSGEKSGQGVEYLQTSPGSGTCVLECHGYNHSPGRY